MATTETGTAAGTTGTETGEVTTTGTTNATNATVVTPREYLVFAPRTEGPAELFEIVWQGKALGPDQALDAYADSLKDAEIPNGLVPLAASAWRPRTPEIEPPPPPKRTWK